MIKIAVVGDIGSGKSHIAKLFGYPVFNADQEVVSIYKKNKNCFKKLKKILPEYFPAFPANKIQIIKAIEDSEKNLKKINHKEKNYTKIFKLFLKSIKKANNANGNIKRLSTSRPTSVSTFTFFLRRL